MFIERRLEKEGPQGQLGIYQDASFEALPGAGNIKTRDSKGNITRRAAARGTIKSRDVGIIEKKEKEGDDTIKIFPLEGLKYVLSLIKGTDSLKSPKIKRFLNQGNKEGEKKSFLLSAKVVNISLKNFSLFS